MYRFRRSADDLEDSCRATLVELVNTTGEQQQAITSVIAWLLNLSNHAIGRMIAYRPLLR